MATYAVFEDGRKLIYIIVKYTKNQCLDPLKVAHCRIQVHKNYNGNAIKRLKAGGELIWEESDEKPSRQVKIDDFFTIQKEFSVTIK